MGGGGPRSRASKPRKTPPAFKKQKTRERVLAVSMVSMRACVRAANFIANTCVVRPSLSNLGRPFAARLARRSVFFCVRGELNRRSCHHRAAYHYFARLLQQTTRRPRYQLTRSAMGRRSFYGACVPSRADSAARRSTIGAALGGGV